MSKPSIETWKILETISRKSPSETLDPISEYLQNYFNNLPKVIVAHSYEHCIGWARRNGIPKRNLLMVSTSDYTSTFNLMGRRLHRCQVFIYETAWWGKHITRVLDELECRYVD